MRRSPAPLRVVPSLAAVVVPVGVAAIVGADGPDEQRARARTPLAPPTTRAQSREPSPARSTLPRAATVSPVPAAARARAREFLTGYLALLHGRGSIRALQPVAAREVLRDLRRNPSRVTPAQQQTRSRIVHLSVELRSAASVRAVAAVKERGGPSYPLQVYLERSSARWVVTRIGDA